MTLKGNKGELSELYAFFKLLADGRLYCGDGQLNKYDDKYYPILKVFRDDAPNRNSYVVNSATHTILIAGETINIAIPQERFQEKASFLLNHIRTLGNDNDISHIEQFMKEIDCNTAKAKSTDKADIRIVIHNLNTGSKPELGYSIKSKLGADSTLINSNKNGTNFIYKVDGIDQIQAEKCNTIKKFKAKFEYLNEIGASTHFVGVANSTLHNNLTLLDLGIERIIAEELIGYYRGCDRTIENLTALVTTQDPLQILNGTNQPMYEYKVKQFLLAFALGMTCTTPWYGTFNANGGYIIVKEDGDIVCYHFFDRNDLENYLFYNTRFETPSTSRHEFGDIYRDGDSFYIKLNLQVRFK